MKKRYLFIVSIALVGTITATSAKAIDLSGIINSALNSTGIIQGIQASLPAPISNYVLKAIGVEGSAASYSSSPGDFQEAVGALGERDSGKSASTQQRAETANSAINQAAVGTATSKETLKSIDSTVREVKASSSTLRALGNVADLQAQNLKVSTKNTEISAQLQQSAAFDRAKEENQAAALRRTAMRTSIYSGAAVTRRELK
jgi:hypothetical protein